MNINNITNFELPTLYKRTSTGAIEQWTIVIEGSSFYTKAGQFGGKITTSAPTICEGKNEGKANERTPEEQAQAEARAKWTKQQDKGYTEHFNLVDEAQEAFYRPMLAHKYQDHKDKIEWPTKFKITTEDGKIIEVKTDTIVKLINGTTKKVYQLHAGDEVESFS